MLPDSGTSSEQDTPDAGKARKAGVYIVECVNRKPIPFDGGMLNLLYTPGIVVVVLVF